MNDYSIRDLTALTSSEPAFRQLRSKTRLITGALLGLFVLIYGVYVGTAVYASDWVASRHIGPLSVAWVIAFAASLMPVSIALTFVRYSDNALEPLVTELRRHAEQVTADE